MTKAIDINGITGEVVERNLNENEVEVRKQLIEKQKIRLQAAEAKQVARLALLDRLGLTEQEAQLLLGS